MFFLVSSGNFLMFFLSLELATIPVAAMANFDLHKKISSEGAMKFILSSAFSSGILLFGISLIYGATGTISFTELPALITGNSFQILAFVFLFTAFAFKMSIVPFHLWTADVYEGSPMATTSFLSVISKGAVAFIFITALYKVFQPMQEVWYNMIMLLVHHHDDHRKSFCIAATKHQTVSCFFFHRAGRFYFGRHQRQFAGRAYFRCVFCFDLCVFKPCGFWCGSHYFIAYRQRKDQRLQRFL